MKTEETRESVLDAAKYYEEMRSEAMKRVLAVAHPEGNRLGVSGKMVVIPDDVKNPFNNIATWVGEMTLNDQVVRFAHEVCLDYLRVEDRREAALSALRESVTESFAEAISKEVAEASLHLSTDSLFKLLEGNIKF